MSPASLAVLLLAGHLGGLADVPRILVLGSPAEPVRDTYVEALRIQLGEGVVVETGPALPDGSMSVRLSEAAAALEPAGAMLATWMETAPAEKGGTDVVVYAVGRHRTRALIEVARLPATDLREVDRAIAIKVGELLATVLRSAREAEADLAASGALPPVVKPAPAPKRVFFFEAGVAGMRTTSLVGTQPGAVLGGGVIVATPGSWSLEAVGTFRRFTQAEISAGGSRVVTKELDTAVGTRATFRAGGLAVGGGAELCFWLLDSEGSTGDGRSGARIVGVPALRIALEGRWVFRRIELRLDGGLEIPAWKQVFQVAGMPLHDYGTLRPAGQLSVIFPIR